MAQGAADPADDGRGSVDRAVLSVDSGDRGEQFVELVEERVDVLVGLAHDGQALRAAVDDLRAGQTLLEPVEAFRVHGGVAVEERFLELVGDRFDLQRCLFGALVVDVAARLLDEPVDVCIAAEDHELLAFLVDGAGGFGVRLVDVAERDAGQGGLLVVCVSVALDLHEGDAVEDGAGLHERFEHAAREGVVGEFRGFRECERHDGSFRLMFSSFPRTRPATVGAGSAVRRRRPDRRAARARRGP